MYQTLNTINMHIELEGTRSDHVYAEYIILISVGIVSKNVHLETNFFFTLIYL